MANMKKPVPMPLPAKPMPTKGTQADHHVTDNNSHTQTVKPTGSLTGDAAVAEYQRQVSPQGMKQSQDNIRKATDKQYPGLYKK